MNAITRHLLAWSKNVNVSPLNRKLLRDLWRLRGQIIAIAAVVAAGIGLLVAAFGCIASLNASMDGFYERYRFAEVFATVKRAPNSLNERLQSIPGIAILETRVSAGATLDIPGMTEPAMGRLLSIPEGKRPLLNDILLLQGRLVNLGRDAEVIVSDAFAKAHGMILGDQLSAIMNGKKRKLDIVGIAMTPEYIYALAPGQLMPDDKRFGVIWMGRKALAAAYDLDEAFNSVTATLLHGTNEEEVLTRLDDILKPFGGGGAYARKDQISHFFLSSEIGQLGTMGTIGPPIFLGVAAFLLNIVISRLVATEREQIGLLKAFGYSDLEVGWQYLKLILALSILGLIAGLALGLWLGRLMTDLYAAYYKFPLLDYQVEPKVFLLAAGVSLGAGLVGGLNAVRQAVRLSPAVAMAPPMPTSYRRSGFSQLLAGFRFSQPTRMIFRHVTRWPLRTGMTVIGIAFSSGVLVASLFFIDTVEHVIDTAFFQAERQTATLNFVEPRAAIVEQEIRHLPGVLATQPVRTVSARLRNGQFTKRMAVSGIVTHAQLNRLLDTGLKSMDPPPGGLAVSTHMAEQLHLHMGDTVRVEVLQEKRPVVDLTVTAIVEQYMGLSAYMNLEALNRMMNEGPTVTGVHVLADRAALDALYLKVKNRGAIAGVALRDAALVGFRSTMENTLYVMITIFVGFALLIALGVSYSSARIALSERARALASLRVLGFTRAETAYILLGELGVVTLIALPFGSVLGYGLALLMSPMLKTDMYMFPLIISDATYGLAVVVIIVAAVICSVLVRRKVYDLDLVAVLKTRD